MRHKSTTKTTATATPKAISTGSPAPPVSWEVSAGCLRVSLVLFSVTLALASLARATRKRKVTQDLQGKEEEVFFHLKEENVNSRELS